ncbi:MAG: hypothetical protein HKO57_07635 [Akkermansiaceae bacterium]|nr:hypothetical protein [Akkermansiaceae bacterium]
MLFVATGAVQGQLRSGLEGGPDPADLPPAPDSHVFDSAELFKRDPDTFRQISERLTGLREKHGLPVYLAVYGGILTGGVSDRAEALYATWVGKGNDGVVVVCDTDTRSLDMGLPPASHHGISVDEDRLTRLPDYKMIPIMRKMQVELNGEEDQVLYLDRMTEILAEDLDALLSARREGLRDVSTWKFILAVLVVGAVLAGLGVLGHRFISNADLRARQRFYLPDVMVGSRLGAPCGGGRVSESSFPAAPPGP